MKKKSFTKSQHSKKRLSKKLKLYQLGTPGALPQPKSMLKHHCLTLNHCGVTLSHVAKFVWNAVFFRESFLGVLALLVKFFFSFL